MTSLDDRTGLQTSGCKILRRRLSEEHTIPNVFVLISVLLASGAALLGKKLTVVMHQISDGALRSFSLLSPWVHIKKKVSCSTTTIYAAAAVVRIYFACLITQVALSHSSGKQQVLVLAT